jgi:tRNA(fMet)-specific endonuclease VapC
MVMGLLSYLLDSHILSEPSRAHPNVHVQARLLAHRHAVCTAASVLHEMRYGLARMPDGRRKQALAHYLEQAVHQRLTILPYDRAAAIWHAEERARLTIAGRTPPFIDGQIAAITMINGLILVTRNTNDFADFAGLTVENWFEE